MGHIFRVLVERGDGEAVEELKVVLNFESDDGSEFVLSGGRTYDDLETASAYARRLGRVIIEILGLDGVQLVDHEAGDA